MTNDKTISVYTVLSIYNFTFFLIKFYANGGAIFLFYVSRIFSTPRRTWSAYLEWKIFCIFPSVTSSQQTKKFSFILKSEHRSMFVQSSISKPTIRYNFPKLPRYLYEPMWQKELFFPRCKPKLNREITYQFKSTEPAKSASVF